MSDASSRPPGTTWLLRHNHFAAACALLALLVCLVPLGIPRANAASSSVSISVDTNVPAVSSGSQPIVVSGTITNTGSTRIAHPVVHLSVSKQLLDRQTTADGWMSGSLDIQPLTQVATGSADAVSPGGVTSFAVTIPSAKLKFGYGLASLPLLVTVTDGNSTAASAIRGTVRTAVQQQNTAVHSPLQVTIVVPLTLPADPDLFGPDNTTRAQAWEQALGPDGQVQQTLDAFSGMPVTFAVDPALLEPPAAADDNVPSPTPTPTRPTSTHSSTPSSSQGTAESSGSGTTPNPTSTDAPTSSTDATDRSSTAAPTGAESPGTGSPSPTSTSTTPPTPAERITTAVNGLISRLDTLDTGQTVWWLPFDDPDLAGLQAAGAPGARLLQRDLTRALPAAARRVSTTRVLWPTGDVSASTVTSAARQLKSDTSSVLAVLPTRAVGSAQTEATYRVAGTSGVLTYDERLSSLFSSSTTSPGVQSSRLLTDLLALYQQSPGTPRSVALVAPRTGGANPIQLATQVQALQAAHWVQLRTGTATEQAFRTAPATALLAEPTKGTPYPSAPAVAITASELRDLDRSRHRLAALQSVLVGGNEVLPERRQALDVIGSTRWRGARAQLAVVADRDNAAVSSMLSKLSVRSSTINFFADSGDISVTVSNQLARPVHDVQLLLVPRNYLVQVTEPQKAADIDAGAHATARFHLKAVGGGTVPVDAVLLAPDGSPLGAPGPPAQLKINVHPTSGWIMWVLGALAALILAIGLWRAVRRGPRTAAGTRSTEKPLSQNAIVDAGPVEPPTKDTETDD
ncbi:DUF6049 family protein [Flexivirga caeni]|uniref:Uncharacterized protein n=1 Tax=Flexivirga caeni TaxID=2294115 RepID=A0A3M9M270_9MICO|nr:DUF6049 family protein [Flexivirga caeni]RNI19640.1 hypothetical protein EFY87_16205 [Flexivirga caeni]